MTNPSRAHATVQFGVVGDVHANFARLDRVLRRLARERLDAILFVGDLGSHDLSYARRRTPERDARYLASVEEVLRRGRDVAERVLYVPGNHDLPDLAFDGNVDARVVEVAGVRVGGIGGAGPGRFGFAYEWEEEAIRARAELDCDVLLCHAPPARTPLDRLALRPEHVGSEAIRERAERHGGALVCGHIHEAAGIVQLGACLCVNAGGLGAPFEADQVALLRLEDGVWSARHEELASGRVVELVQTRG
ncbi:MAG: metallophosphoesterase family protein [Planctomycetes bacterium]|nr:metallophosphoesterase family protein [Planctomycetota bacterium]